MLKTLLLATLATTTLFAVAVPAHAGEAPTARVSYADLDLGSAAGRATLDRRIAGAVRAVCPAATVQTPAEVGATNACHRTARASAATQVAALTNSVRLASR